MSLVAPGSVARRQSPSRGAVALVFAGIVDAIGAVYLRDAPVVVEIIGVAVSLAARIEAEERVVREEEWTAGGHPYRQLDAVIRVPVHVMVAVARLAPAPAVLHGTLGLTRPAAVVHLPRHAVRGRGDGQQIRDHGLVPADERVLEIPGVVRRPVPDEESAVGGLAMPAPFDAFPQRRDTVVQRKVGFEVLARGQQALSEEGGLDQVAAVIVTAEQGNHAAGAPAHEVRPDAVKPVCLLEEIDDLSHARRALRVRDEAALRADDERHDAEA